MHTILVYFDNVVYDILFLFYMRRSNASNAVKYVIRMVLFEIQYQLVNFVDILNLIALLDTTVLLHHDIETAVWNAL